MYDYQGAMGDIQDMKVLLSTFEDFSERDTPYNPKPVLRYYRQRCKEAVNVFSEHIHQVSTFWRTESASLPVGCQAATKEIHFYEGARGGASRPEKGGNRSPRVLVSVRGHLDTSNRYGTLWPAISKF